MERSTSLPPPGRLVSVDVGNPFYPEKNQGEYRLRASRPQGLPEHSPGSDGGPIHHGSQGAGQCTGKGRGGLSSTKPAVFVTPPSRKSGRGGNGMGPVSKQSEGRMSDESEATVKYGEGSWK